MTLAHLEVARVWVATLSEPAAVVVFGLILARRLGALHRDVKTTLESGLGRIESAITSQGATIRLLLYEQTHPRGGA